MRETNKKYLANFFISSFRDVATYVNHLSFVAKQAYFARKYDALSIYGNRLIDLSPETESLGRYYLALAHGQYWSANVEQVKRTFEDLAESDQTHVRAASLLALAGEKILRGKPNEEAAKLLIDSSAVALSGNHLATFVQSQNNLSLLFSLQEDHHQSLHILKGLRPIVDCMGSSYVKTDYYNSVAYELFQLGEREAARYFASYVLKSPHLPMYPEWQSNLRTILTQNITKPLVAVNNVLKFPGKKRCTETGKITFTFKTKSFTVGRLEPSDIEDLCRYVDAVNAAKHRRKDSK